MADVVLISDSELMFARADAEGEMRDVCEVREAPTSSAMDPETGEVVETPGAVVYGPSVAPYFGRFRIPIFQRLTENEPEAGGHRFVTRRFPISFPVGAPPILESYRVSVVESPATPTNVGREFLVTAPLGSTAPTAQRVVVEELVGHQGSA